MPHPLHCQAIVTELTADQAAGATKLSEAQAAADVEQAERTKRLGEQKERLGCRGYKEHEWL